MIDKTFRKLTVRSIRTNFKQFLSVILIVLLGTMLLSGFITNSNTLRKGINGYFDDTKLADLWLYVDNVSEEDEEFFKSNNIEYGKRLYIETSAKFSELQIQNNSKIFVTSSTISKPYIESNNADLLQGRDVCLIDKNVAADRNITINHDVLEFSVETDTLIEMLVSSGKLSSMFGPVVRQILGESLSFQFMVNGTMCFDECADTYSSWPVYISEGLFLNGINDAIKQKLKEANLNLNYSFDSLFYNQIVVKCDNVEETKAKILDYYEGSKTNLSIVLDRNSVESVVLLNSEIDQAEKMIYVFPVIFLIVSVLVILTTINQLVLQEKQRIGTLKSIGVPDRKILYHYSRYGGVLCLLGAIVGTILGVLVVPRIMLVKYNLVYSVPGDYLTIKVPFLILISVLLGITLMGFLVALSACFNILHKKPVECLRYDINFNMKLKGKKRKNKIPLPIKMSARNVKLKPVRAMMAMLGIAGCVALLLCGFGISDTINNSVDNDIERMFHYDVMTTYSEADFNQKLSEMEGYDNWFDSSEKFDTYFAEIITDDKAGNVSLFEMETDSKLSEIKLARGEVSVSHSIAYDYGLAEGDSFQISVGGETKTLTVTHIIKTCASNGIYVGTDSEFSLGLSEKLCSKGLWIKLNTENLSGEDVAKIVEQINLINGTDGARSMNDVRENVENKISSIGIMTTTLKTFAILLAIVVLFNLIFLIIKERTREIATLKVLGTGNINITLTIFCEIMIMAVFGVVLGLLLGYPLLILVMTINRVKIFNFLYNLTATSYLLSVVIIFATIFVVTMLCHLKVRKVNMIESLKSVE